MDDREKMKEELPMNWWNFWKYFRFPVGLFVSIFNFIASLTLLEDVELNIYGKIILFINFALIIFLCVTFYYFALRKKYGFEMLIVYSIAEILFNSFINISNNNYIHSNNITELVIETLIVACIVSVIWVYPNYIYFKKRSHLFGAEEEKQNIDEENTENIKQGNKKYCTKCGKQIEQDWMFCNYCGNKLK